MMNSGRFVVVAAMLLAAMPAVARNPLGAEKDMALRGGTPLRDGLNAWYYGLDTALSGHRYIGDVIDDETVFTNFRGEKVRPHASGSETARNYENSHNHYQNLFVQTLNKRENVNAVSIWGDSTSIVNGAKSWGGFFSARSACFSYARGGVLEKYGTRAPTDCKGVDNQLIGVEIDVLNGSKPGVYPNMSKTGLQIVGFGNPNSMAIEVRSEDTDRLEPGKIPHGAFEAALYVKNSIQPDYGRMIVADFDRAGMGIDFRRPLFKEGAIRFRSEGLGTGLVVNEGKSGEIYGGERWPGFQDQAGWLTARNGEGGFRVVSNDNTREVMAVDNFGGIYLNGDVYLNGKRLTASNPWLDWRYWTFGLALVLVNVLVGIAVTRRYGRSIS